MMNCATDVHKKMRASQPIIMLVDDDPDCLFLLERMFIRHGFLVHCEQNPITVISTAQAINPDMILIDCRMPGMGGIDLCRLIKSDKQTRDTPVVMMSGADNGEEACKAIEAGSLAYIHKDVSVAEIPRHLINVMKEHDLLSDNSPG